MTTTKIKTIEIRVNGTEVIKQDWSNHGMIVTGQVLFRAMDKAAHDLAETLYRHRQQHASKEFDSSSNPSGQLPADRKETP